MSTTNQEMRRHRPLRTNATLDSDAEVEEAERHGRTYLVFPLVAAREMVLHYPENGTKELLPKERIAESVQWWAGTPITFVHPENEGQTAEHPTAYVENNIGQAHDPQLVDDDKLRVYAWLDVQKAKDIGGLASKVVEKLRNGEELSVSAGYSTLDDKFQGGTYDGEEYDVEQGILIPDHIAIFPSDQFRARCTPEDGCAAPRHNAIVPNNSPTASRSIEDEGGAGASRVNTSASTNVALTRGKQSGCSPGPCSCGRHVSMKVNWNPELHPRDRYGRFTEKAAANLVDSIMNDGETFQRPPDEWEDLESESRILDKTQEAVVVDNERAEVEGLPTSGFAGTGQFRVRTESGEVKAIEVNPEMVSPRDLDRLQGVITDDGPSARFVAAGDAGGDSMAAAFEENAYSKEELKSELLDGGEVGGAFDGSQSDRMVDIMEDHDGVSEAVSGTNPTSGESLIAVQGSDSPAAPDVEEAARDVMEEAEFDSDSYEVRPADSGAVFIVPTDSETSRAMDARDEAEDREIQPPEPEEAAEFLAESMSAIAADNNTSMTQEGGTITFRNMDETTLSKLRSRLDMMSDDRYTLMGEEDENNTWRVEFQSPSTGSDTSPDVGGGGGDAPSLDGFDPEEAGQLSSSLESSSSAIARAEVTQGPDGEDVIAVQGSPTDTGDEPSLEAEVESLMTDLGYSEDDFDTYLSGDSILIEPTRWNDGGDTGGGDSSSSFGSGSPPANDFDPEEAGRLEQFASGQSGVASADASTDSLEITSEEDNPIPTAEKVMEDAGYDSSDYDVVRIGPAKARVDPTRGSSDGPVDVEAGVSLVEDRIEATIDASPAERRRAIEEIRRQLEENDGAVGASIAFPLEQLGMSDSAIQDILADLRAEIRSNASRANAMTNDPPDAAAKTLGRRVWNALGLGEADTSESAEEDAAAEASDDEDAWPDNLFEDDGDAETDSSESDAESESEGNEMPDDDDEASDGESKESTEGSDGKSEPETTDLDDGESSDTDTDNDNMPDVLSIEDLAAKSAFGASTLQEWDDEQLKALEATILENNPELREQAESNDSSGGGESNQNASEEAADAGEEENMKENSDTDALRQEVEELKAMVEDSLNQRQNYEEEQKIRTVCNAIDGMTEEAARKLDSDDLDSLAEEHGTKVNARTAPGGHSRNPERQRVNSEPEDVNEYPAGGRSNWEQRKGGE